MDFALGFGFFEFLSVVSHASQELLSGLHHPSQTQCISLPMSIIRRGPAGDVPRADTRLPDVLHIAQLLLQQLAFLLPDAISDRPWALRHRLICLRQLQHTPAALSRAPALALTGRPSASTRASFSGTAPPLPGPLRTLAPPSQHPTASP